MKFHITCDVKKATGTQVFFVEAKDLTEAKAKFDAGESDFISEEIEVVSLGEPSFEESTEKSLPPY